MKRLYSLLALAALAGCGGGSGSHGLPPATGLSYVDPAGGGWRLVKDPASTPARLLLKLVGPAGLKGRGVGITVRSPQTLVAFGKFADGSYIKDGGVFTLANSATEPKLLAGGVKGDNLMLGSFQKRRSSSAKALDGTLLSFNVDFRGGGGHPGDPVPFDVMKAQIVPEDISTIETSRMVPITVAVGTLSLQ